MRKSIAVFLFAAIIAIAAKARAVPTIVVGNYLFQQDSGIHQIPVYATGGPNDFLTSLTFVAITGDGGPSAEFNFNTDSGAGVVPAPDISADIWSSTGGIGYGGYHYGPTLLNPGNASAPQDLGQGYEGTQTVILSDSTLGAELSMNGKVLLGVISV